MKSGWRRLLADQSGVMAVIAALGLLVVLGMGALTLDLGHLYVVKRELQTAAEAGAMAGARALAPYQTDKGNIGQALWANGPLTATQTVQKNKADAILLTACQAQAGYWNLTWTWETAPASLQPQGITPTSFDIPAVKVTINKTEGQNGGPVSMFFAPILGIHTVSLRAESVAILPLSPDSIPEGGLFPMAIGNTVLVSYDWEAHPTVTIHDSHEPGDGGWWTTFLQSNPSNAYIKNLISGDELSPPLKVGDSIYMAPGVRASDFKEALDHRLNQVVLLPVISGGDWGGKDTRQVEGFVAFKITGGSQGGKYLNGYFDKNFVTAGQGVSGGPNYGIYGTSIKLVF